MSLLLLFGKNQHKNVCLGLRGNEYNFLKFILSAMYTFHLSHYSHLARNPFICDCNLRWLADYMHKNPIETSGARCDAPKRMHRRRIESLKDEKFKCKSNESSRVS